MLQDTRSQIRSEVDDIAHEVDSAGEQLRQGITSDAGSAEPAAAVEHAAEADTGTTISPAVSGQTHSDPASGEPDAATKRDEESHKP